MKMPSASRECRARTPEFSDANEDAATIESGEGADDLLACKLGGSILYMTAAARCRSMALNGI